MWSSPANLFKMKQVQKVGKVARAICIMSHPIPDTNDSHSVQVILPQKQLGRKSDMYVRLIPFLFLFILLFDDDNYVTANAHFPGVICVVHSIIFNIELHNGTKILRMFFKVKIVISIYFTFAILVEVVVYF